VDSKQVYNCAVRLPACIVACALLTGLTAPQTGKPVSSPTTDPAAIAHTLQKLQKVELADDMGYTVPPAARPLLTQVKHQLRDFIQETINEPALAGSAPADLTTALVDGLTRAGVEVGGNHWSSYGYVQSIEIEQLKDHPDLLVAITTFNIACGYDSSLYVFERRPAGWSLILVLEANDYEEVKGAQGSLGYALSPPDASGDWFLVAADITPWCTSMWHGLRYKVLRPAVSAYEPKVLFQDHDAIWLGDETTFELTSDASSFTLTFKSWFALDPRIHSRDYTRSFQVAGDHVTRLPPLGLRPQDFVDEWVHRPWQEAAPWVVNSNLETLRDWHSKLQEHDYYSEIEFVQPCDKEPSRWQIGLLIEVEKGKEPLPGELFFGVIRKQGAYYLTDVSPTRPLGCPGEAFPE
jgi:hypothetical protein